MSCCFFKTNPNEILDKNNDIKVQFDMKAANMTSYHSALFLLAISWALCFITFFIQLNFGKFLSQNPHTEENYTCLSFLVKKQVWETKMLLKKTTINYVFTQQELDCQIMYHAESKKLLWLTMSRCLFHHMENVVVIKIFRN